MDPAFVPRGEGNQSALSRVDFDCQSKLESLQKKFEEMKSEYEEQGKRLRKVETTGERAAGAEERVPEVEE